MVPKKPADVPPMEMMGSLFGGVRVSQQEELPKWRRRLADTESRVLGLPWRRMAQAIAVLVMVVGGLTGWIYRQPLDSSVTAFIAKATGAVVDKIVVSGAVYTGKDELQQALGLERGSSLVGFDAASARARLEALPWVRLASVERQLPDTVNVQIYEYVPLARLVDDGKIWIINKDGNRIVADDDNRFPGLPLLQGKGAAKAAGELFTALSAWPQLQSQLREADWMGDRRWNLRFVSGVVVELPEDTAERGVDTALATLARLEEARHVLTLNAGEVDLRLPDRIVLRLPDDVGETPVTDKPARAG